MSTNPERRGPEQRGPEQHGPEQRGLHDMGGDPDHLWSGPVPRGEHVLSPWEKEVDAMLVLLVRGGRMTVDELRLGIEQLSGEDYARLGYYERWLASIVWTMERKGIIPPGSVASRAAALRAAG